MSLKIAVVKFGSSILSDKNQIPKAIHEVYRHLREGYRVLVVVSAMGDTTDQLEQTAKSLYPDQCSQPTEALLAELLATGEMASSALFTIGLHEAGISAHKLNYTCLNTKGPVLDSEPDTLNQALILDLFKKYAVLVVPGFIGADEKQAVTLLGRGGSDFSAVFFAVTLNAERCILYKDTNGIFNHDPNLCDRIVERYKTLTFQDCLKIAYPVVQHKALKFAADKNFNFYVKSLGSQDGTLIGSAFSSFYQKNNPNKKLKIILLGLGTVGLGVYQHLRAANELFEIVGVGVKNPAKYTGIVPLEILSTQPIELLQKECDVVIELIGGLSVANVLITEALKQGRHVITANKLLIAEHGVSLTNLAKTHGVKLLYSAAVAGSVPILEVLKQMNNIKSITGILNGTCNFILDKMKQGETCFDAIRAAQLAGFAESDPTLDIEGHDAAHKLKILSRLAFGEVPQKLFIEGITHISPESIKIEEKRHHTIKLLAECRLTGDSLEASVTSKAIPYSHPLANISAADNSILIETISGETIQLSGKGAGRWPTAESVFADLFDLLLQHEPVEEIFSSSLKRRAS